MANLPLILSGAGPLKANKSENLVLTLGLGGGGGVESGCGCGGGDEDETEFFLLSSTMQRTFMEEDLCNCAG